MNLAQLNAQIQAQQKKVDEASAQLAHHRKMLQDWLAAQEADAANNASYQTRQHTARRIAEEQEAVKQWERTLERETAELGRLEALRAAIDAATVNAVAQGLTPEAAQELAAAQVLAAETRRKVLQWVGYGLLAVAVIGGIIILRRVLRK
jgi:hypothetical protein